MSHATAFAALLVVAFGQFSFCAAFGFRKLWPYLVFTPVSLFLMALAGAFGRYPISALPPLRAAGRASSRISRSSLVRISSSGT